MFATIDLTSAMKADRFLPSKANSTSSNAMLGVRWLLPFSCSQMRSQTSALKKQLPLPGGAPGKSHSDACKNIGVAQKGSATFKT
jgi:hypothetical protein